MSMAHLHNSPFNRNLASLNRDLSVHSNSQRATELEDGVSPKNYQYSRFNDYYNKQKAASNPKTLNADIPNLTKRNESDSKEAPKNKSIVPLQNADPHLTFHNQD